MSLIGSLNEIALADVLRLLGGGRKSGLLTVTGEGQQALVRLHRGELVQAFSGRLQGEEALLDLFGWEDGQLAFVPEERSVTPNLARPLAELVEEGVLRGGQVHRMNRVLSSDRVVFHMAMLSPESAARLTVDAADWRILRLLDGSRDLGEVVEASEQPRAQVLLRIFQWLEAGFLEKVEPARNLRVQGHGTSVFGARDVAEMDARVQEDWKRILRFEAGVRRVEVRSHGGRAAEAAASFRPGLHRDITLPKGIQSSLGVREGEDVSVRPVG